MVIMDFQAFVNFIGMVTFTTNLKLHLSSHLGL